MVSVLIQTDPDPDWIPNKTLTELVAPHPVSPYVATTYES